jgi:hypothetical protein
LTGAAATDITDVGSDPEPRAKTVAAMQLKREERILTTLVSMEEIVTGGEKPCAGGGLEKPVPERLRNADFRFEGSSVCAYVDESGWNVLPGRPGHRQANACCGGGGTTCEFLRR